MMESIIVAVITGCFALIGTIWSNRKTAALIEYRLEELEKRVDKHNTVIERTYALEKRADVFDEKQKVANNRISDLEKKVG